MPICNSKKFGDLIIKFNILFPVPKKINVVSLKKILREESEKVLQEDYSVIYNLNDYVIDSDSGSDSGSGSYL